MTSWPRTLLRIRRHTCRKPARPIRGTPLPAPLSPPFNPPSAADHVTGAIPNIPLRNWRTQRHLSRAEMADRINAITVRGR